jgi:hypothetical protein
MLSGGWLVNVDHRHASVALQSAPWPRVPARFLYAIFTEVTCGPVDRWASQCDVLPGLMHRNLLIPAGSRSAPRGIYL